MAHRYWRVHITQSTSSGMLISLYEVEMRAAGSGVDLCSGGTASASHADADAAKLFDNNPSNYWNNGSPGVDSWFKYDFGAGNPVAVGEVWFLPRYASQTPQAFQCQWSDDGSTWHTQGSWNDITSWSGGIWKSFTLPPPDQPVVTLQRLHPYDLPLIARHLRAHDLGLFAHNQAEQRFGLFLETGHAHPFAWTLSRVHAQFHGFVLTQTLAQPHDLSVESHGTRRWIIRLESHLHQPRHDLLDAGRSSHWSLNHPLDRDHTQPSADTTTITPAARQLRLCDLLEHDPACARVTAHWDLLPPATLPTPNFPAVSWNNRPLALIRATLSFSPEQSVWVARLVVADDAVFGATHADQPLDLTWGATLFRLFVVHKELIRTRPGHAERIITALGLPARHDTPHAPPFTRRWDAPVWARDAVEQTLNESVIWRLPAWRLPAGRLSVREVAPLEVARRIAQAAGGVVRSRPDGTLVLERRYPRPVPEWERDPPDHILTDAADLLESRDEGRFGTGVNRITLQEQTPELQSPGLWLEIDPDSEARTRFATEQTVRLVTLASPGVALQGVEGSACTRMPDEPIWRAREETVRFKGSNRAVLSRPATRIDAVEWLGNALGEVTLERDGRTVTASGAGVALARLQVTLALTGCHPFKAPGALAGADRFPALFSARGEVVRSQGLEHKMTRGDGPPWRDGVVESPLLSEAVALQARGEAELDAGERLQKVELTLLHRPEIRPGAGVEVHDGWFGRAYRGVVTGVSHELSPTRANTRLEVVKRPG
ncbi:MAG: discoidin domain-containing protein [Magnetococcales bacterium]|nr:discoidin domain-containing protein [Magnetococcales bacterium]